MAQKHNSYEEKPMTRYGTIQSPSRRYRRLRHPIFNASEWTAKNPLLQRGEIGFELDTHKAKVGDGTTYWNDLPYSFVAETEWGNIVGDIADQTDLQNALGAISGDLNDHIADKNNPHEVTKAQVGLGNVDNTSDLNKPISTATQTALNAKQDTLTAGTNITITNNVISSTAQESFFRGNFNEWSDVPTNVNLYVEDIHGNRIPQDTDFIVIEDASQFVPSGSLMHKLTVENLHATESFTIRITDENGVSQKYFYYPYRNGFVEIDEYYSLRYDPGTTGYWYIKTNDGSPIVIKGTTYSSGQAQLCTTNDPTTPFDVGMPPSAGQYTGAWRFAYYGVWATAGITGWTPQYKIENTLPIANETTFGIAKLYTTTGNNTDGAVDQATVTSALGEKQDVLTAGTNISISGSTISATDTTYTGSDGITLTGTNFTNSGVRAVASGTANGTISVNTNGTSADVAVTGLGSAAYTSSSDYATSAQGGKADTAVQPGDLATVATTGSYNDLLNKPTIPAAQVNSDWDAVSGVAQILNKPTLGTMAAESASDYTPTSGLATVATTGDYDDLLNKPTIPTVNDATLTIQKNGTTVNTFTANASSNVTANITVPTKISDLTNDSNFANTDLSNLTSTGANIGNWSSNVTNCITEIPQDINLTLSGGTLTLKTGSKCYLKTDTTTPSVSVASDLTTTQTTDGTYFAIYNGSGLSTVLTTAYDYSTLPNTYSLPLAVVTVSSGAISSIDQVFNGFGYIGSTVFVLPGVSAAVSEGFNTDGSLKNTITTTSSVKTIDVSASGYVALTPYDALRLVTRGNYYIVNNQSEMDALNVAGFYYVKQENKCYSWAGGSGTKYYEYVPCIKISYSGGKITAFSNDLSFHAVDYNDTDFIAHQSMPSRKYIYLTLPASGNTITAPADGYLAISKSTNAVGQYLVLYNSAKPMRVSSYTPVSGYFVNCVLPVCKGDAVNVSYSAGGSTAFCAFVYVNGAK